MRCNMILSDLKAEAVTFRNAYERCTTAVGKEMAKRILGETKADIEYIERARRIERVK